MYGLNEWVKGLRVFEENNLFAAWSVDSLAFYALHRFSKEGTEQGKVRFSCPNLMRLDDAITDVLVFTKYKYFINGTKSGVVQVWNLTSSKDIVHTFSGHQRSVASLSYHPHLDNIIFSAGKDNTVRAWCLERFAGLYCFDLSATAAPARLQSTEGVLERVTKIKLLGGN